MTQALIMRAGGQIAQHVIAKLAGRADTEMTLYLRDSGKLGQALPANARIVEGAVVDAAQLRQAVAGQDAVYADPAGEVDARAAQIINAMDEEDVAKLIFVTSLEIYDEMPGKFDAWNRREIGTFLPPCRRSLGVSKPGSDGDKPAFM